MIRALYRPVRLLSLMRQFTLLAMLVVQAGFVASPLLEPHPSNRPVTHADRPGTRHAATHNESTCIVCSVRAMHASIAIPPATGATEMDGGAAPLTDVPRAGPQASRSSHPTRAPPRLR